MRIIKTLPGMDTADPAHLAEVLPNYTQDPVSGKWIWEVEPGSPEEYFRDTPRGTPVAVFVHRPADPQCPMVEGFEVPPPESRFKGISQAIFWGLSLVHHNDLEARTTKGPITIPLYRRHAVFRSSLESKRDLGVWLYYSRLDDMVRLEETRRSWSAKLAKETQERLERAAQAEVHKAAQKVAWQEAQARKLEADKLRATELGLDLEAYLEGLVAVRQMRKATRPGHCLICKRPLSLKTSVTRGVGPECFKSLSLAERISAAAQVVAKSGEVSK